MNIQNIRAIMKVLRKSGVVQIPGSAFEIKHRRPIYKDCCHDFYVYYASTTIEASLKALADELSLKPVLDQVNWKDGHRSEGPDDQGMLDHVKDRATAILIEQLEAAKAFLGR